MKDILLNVFDSHAPKITKKIKGKPAPWLTSNVKCLMNERDKLLRKSRRSKLSSDIINYKQKHNAVNIAIRQAKSTYYKDLLKENAGNPNKFWKTVKLIYPTKSKKQNPTQSFQVDEKDLIDSQLIANAFCSFFTGIKSTLKMKANPLVGFVWRKPTNIGRRTENSFNFEPVTTAEIEIQLKAMKRSKATGTDDPPPGMLKTLLLYIRSLGSHYKPIFVYGYFSNAMEICKDYTYV